MFRKKSIQKIKAKAVWNKEKHVWEVIVKQKITARNLYDKYFTTKTKSKVIEVDECDEFVIPWAILEDNGINTKTINKILEKN